ncbi:MAG: bifunctional molybdenum cofactor biosynthesis protein MoaC/MoaB [Candidatus Krumholzibacteria bacterium]|nr:bifunctional molybdenum cofactor biosynthesis protein MoaC/MoaB [Candidatus Krumholzibacteria bacterium]
MKSVTSKTTTLRRATASARVNASPESIRRLQANDLPKKDVLVVAQVAAVAAAKKTPDIIPYCHPLPIDAVDVSFDVADDHVMITVSVEAIWKTGVEMEALTAASVAALTIYDMLKPVDKNIEITSIRLDFKRGGKTEFRDRPPIQFTAAVIVTSDGVEEGKREDRSGVFIRERLESLGITPAYEILPDDEELIIEALRSFIAQETDLVVTAGGTGLGPRDVTVEATRKVIEREIPGIAEAARAHGQARTPYAMLSRGLAGISGRTIIINLPGSLKGTEESLDALFPALLHAYPMIRGGGH